MADTTPSYTDEQIEVLGKLFYYSLRKTAGHYITGEPGDREPVMIEGYHDVFRAAQLFLRVASENGLIGPCTTPPE